MKGIIKKINDLLKRNNLKPIKVVTLPTGVVCAHYSNGNIKVI
tara:strand:+ start:389 stop:517 length:129 start_codon:yes stop_codon:yes gene_type:complete